MAKLTKSGLSIGGGSNSSSNGQAATALTRGYDKRRKVIIVWTCLVSVVAMFVALLLFFYISPVNDCEMCKYFNCIPITKDFCSDQNIDLRSTDV